MSRLNPIVAEENRVAFQDDLKKAAHKKALTKWLRDNPEIGELNGGKYYKMVDSEVVYLEALSEAS